MAYCISRSFKQNIDSRDIFEVFCRRRNCFFLDSSLRAGTQGRYSFLGSDPFDVLSVKGGDPFTALAAALDKYKIGQRPKETPFCSGAVGYFSYDAGFGLEENLRLCRRRAPAIPDCVFGFYNSVVTVDHLLGRIHISAAGFPEKKERLYRLLAEENLARMHKIISAIRPCAKSRVLPQPVSYPGKIESNFSRRDYLAAVKKAKEYIKQGDIYQVNLSQRFQARARLSGSQIYSRLRSISPSAFGAYFNCGSAEILSASPERFLRLEDGRVVTRPMKGTRPRSADARLDARLARQLLDSAKDKAELTMIVDLERNDLGRVCEYDSVRVGRLRELETYRTVYQTTATVEGRLHKDKDRIDLLRACFPGGSITGCPKIRAMEIIDELEPVRRGIYTGALGYLSFCGNMDFNILIRTILKQGNRLYFGAGGGIVADSRPDDEYRETLVKARAMLEAVGVDSKNFLPAVSGSGVFETMRAYQGKIVCFNGHLERIIRSCALLKIKLVYSPRQLKQMIRKRMRSSRSHDIRLRITVKPGKPQAGVLITAEKYVPYPRQKYLRGFSVRVVASRQGRPLGPLKVTERGFYERSLRLVREKGFDEALVLDRRGYLSEATRSNIFFVRDNQLFTPALGCGCLDGITRRVVADLARRDKINIGEGKFSVEDLYAADEAFLTNSLVGIMPLTSLEKEPIGKGKCGALTAKLIKQYRCLLK